MNIHIFLLFGFERRNDYTIEGASIKNSNYSLDRDALLSKYTSQIEK
jgi:hypothetical protein